MKLTESEKANPQDYYLQSGVDSEGNPIYDLLNEDIADYAPAKAFRKKVFDGNADIVVLANKIQIYWKSNLIAEAELEGQVETSPGVWQGQLFSFADANIKKITSAKGWNRDSERVGDYEIGPTQYTGTISNVPIKPGSILFYCRYKDQRITDDGAGNLIGDGSGTIDYTTGEYDVTFNLVVTTTTTSTSSTTTSTISTTSTLSTISTQSTTTITQTGSTTSTFSTTTTTSSSLTTTAPPEGIEVSVSYEHEVDIDVTPFFRANVVKDIPALGITDAVMGMDVHWAFKETKLSFYLDTPGFNARIRWQARVKDSAVYVPPVLDGDGNVITPAEKGLQFNVQDYEGEVNHGSMADPEPGWTIHWWTFEPNGKQIDVADARTPLERYEQGVGLVVDPYLSVDEQATYFNIACDGYIYRIWKTAGSGDNARCYDPTGATVWLYIQDRWNVSGDVYGLYATGGDMVVTLVENTPSRIIITQKGVPYSGAADMPNTNYAKVTYVIYPDRIFMTYEISTSADNSLVAYDYDILKNEMENLSNLTTYYESSGSEIELSSGNAFFNSAVYLLGYSDEFNMQIINLEFDAPSGSFAFQQEIRDGSLGYIYMPGLVGTGTLKSGITKWTNVYIFDSEDRQGSAKIYDSTDRLAMGNQYKDPFGDVETLGSEILLNPDFSSYSGSDPNVDFDDWVEKEDSGGADWNYTDTACEIDITSTPTNYWDIQIFQTKTLSAFTLYKFEVLVKGDNGAPDIDIIVNETIGYTDFFVDTHTPDGNYNTRSGYFWTGPHTAISAYISFTGSGEPQSGDTLWIRLFSIKEVTSPLKGEYVTDMILPAGIDPLPLLGTLHSDGAHHYEGGEVKDKRIIITKDRTRIRSSHVIHDRRFVYGPIQSPTDILLNHLKMDDNAADNILKAEVGPDGSWHETSDGSARNTNNDSVAIDNFRGRALDTKDDTGYGELEAGLVHNNNFLVKGSALIKITPQFIYTATDQNVWKIYQSTSNMVVLMYEDNIDSFQFRIYWGNATPVEINVSAYTDTYNLQRPHVFLLSWDADKDFVMIAIDGQVKGVATITDTPTASDPTIHYYGTWYDRNFGTNVIADEIKTFSEAVLPYGGFHIGNGDGLLNSISNPHADLCFFWDCQSDSAKGGADLATNKSGTKTGGSYTGTGIVGNYYDNGGADDIVFTNSGDDIFDPLQGSFGLWVNVQSLPGEAGDEKIWGTRYDASNRFFLRYVDVSGQCYFQFTTYRGGTNVWTGITTMLFDIGVWHFVKCKWFSNGDQSIYIDNILSELENNSGTWSGTATNLYIGSDDTSGDNADVLIGRAFISKDPDTPEIWTAFGKPLHIDLVKKNGVYQQYGS